MTDLSGGLNYSHSIQESHYSIGLYASSKRAKGRGEEGGDEGRHVGNLLHDVLDLGNSRGLPPGNETVLSIVEEKAYEKIESKLSLEEADETASDDYWSPENTAGRIVGFALKFYDTFAKKNGDSEETLDKFLKIVRGAIDEGIGEAESIIAEVSGGSVSAENASTISKTRAHIENLLNEFRESALARLRGEATDAGAEEETTDEAAVDEDERIRWVADPVA
jgi:hypothetical protein